MLTSRESWSYRSHVSSQNVPSTSSFNRKTLLRLTCKVLMIFLCCDTMFLNKIKTLLSLYIVDNKRKTWLTCIRTCFTWLSMWIKVGLSYIQCPHRTYSCQLKIRHKLSEISFCACLIRASLSYINVESSWVALVVHPLCESDFPPTHPPIAQIKLRGTQCLTRAHHSKPLLWAAIQFVFIKHSAGDRVIASLGAYRWFRQFVAHLQSTHIT